MNRSRLFTLTLLVGAAMLLTACAGQQGPAGPAGPPGPEGPQGPAGPAGEMVSATDLSCTGCHNDTTLITGKHTAWAESAHGSGEAYVRGTSASCAGCHSGGAFSEMVAAGLNPSTVENGDPNPTRQSCRTCHQVHETYTEDDWALETTDPVDFFAIEGTTFDGGEGNLCANCHQPRGLIGEAVDGMVEITSTHWGPHHGPQSAMLMGLAGAGDVSGSPSAHYQVVENTCVGCHLGDSASHTFEPSVATCQGCHTDADSFDIGGVQTDVQAMLDELETDLIDQGLLDEEGHPTVDTVPEQYAAALWNWIYIAHEDKSLGVHNPGYTQALLEASLEAFK